MLQYGHYSKRRNMSGKCLFLQLKGSNFNLKYDFLTPGGPLYLPTKYRNFAQSPFKSQHWGHERVSLPLRVYTWFPHLLVSELARPPTATTSTGSRCSDEALDERISNVRFLECTWFISVNKKTSKWQKNLYPHLCKKKLSQHLFL